MNPLKCSPLTRPIVVLAIALISGSCAINPVTKEREFVLMSEADEIELGKTFHAQFYEQDRVYDNLHLQGYVNSIGQNLAAVSHRSQLDFHITVIDSPEVNAFALPGGYVYVARGMLAYLNSEAELAAVLGHEIGHVSARHAVRKDARQKARQFLGKSLFNRLGFGLDRSYNDYADARDIDYSQAFELEADELSVEYLIRTGYSPRALENVISTIEGQESLIHSAASPSASQNALYHGFNTHPDSDLRKTLVERDLARLGELPPARSAKRSTYLEKIDGLVFGQSEHGRVIDGHFVHASSEIGFVIPEGWHVNTSSKIIQIVAPDEGAVIQVLNKSHYPGISARQHLQQLLVSDDLLTEQALTSAEVEGWMATSTKQTRDGEIPVWLTTAIGKDVVWVMLATAQDSERFRQIIETTARSFFRPSAQQIAQAEPRRIDIITAQADTTYQKLAAHSRLGADAEQQLRLINGQINPDEQPAVGQLLKVIR